MNIHPRLSSRCTIRGIVTRPPSTPAPKTPPHAGGPD